MQSDLDDDPLGRVLGATYRVEALLGSGGMGAVYRATHLRTGRPYAVKVLLPEVAVRKDAMKRFRREAEAVGALGHANVVAVHDFDVADGWAYLVMDLLEGEDLAVRTHRIGRLSLPETIAIARGIAQGLDAAHARGLIHRDLKPANVFLARQPGAPERAVLLDFGLAKSLAGEAERTLLTASGVVMGTPAYMSPEQASGLPLDARADLYSFATIVYELLAGRTPFEAPTVPALFAKLATEPPPPIRRFCPEISAAVEAVLARGLAKAPAERYPSAAAFVDALAGAEHASVPPTVAVPAPPPPGTPVGNAAASWPRGVPPYPAPAGAPYAHAPQAPRARGASPWILVALAGLLGAGVLGVAGGGVLYWSLLRSDDDVAPRVAARPSAPAPAPGPDRVVVPADVPVPVEREMAGEVVPDEPGSVAPAEVAPAARGRRRRDPA
ncbi:MAG: serine/threonine protein kinase, partial [Sandaracinaceae bacterium]|nr:serine/threonine protein kinase [Sandaracinaceae bacterium]